MDSAHTLTPPYAGHTASVLAKLGRDIADADPLRSNHAGAPAEVGAAVTGAVERLSGDLVALSHEIHANPELAYDEHDAVARIARLLTAHGHEAQIGAYGLPTALRARAGATPEHGAGPRVAVLAEYDALPGLGHACGHNVIAATAVGAFLALADIVGQLGGTVELIGCPAEEGGGGKELIARAGGFDGIDAALMLHPFGFDAAAHPWLGVRTVDVVYHGLPAHAAVSPHLGRNALDAMVNAYQGIAQLRQHMLPTDRVHGIITDGGQKPNIVSARAAGSFFLRSASLTGMTELADRAEAILQAAALGTGTVAEVQWDPCPTYLPVRNNETLAARYAANLESRGRKVLPAGVLPGEMTGSTDLGNVSVRVPAIHPLLAIAPPEVFIHTPEFAQWAVSEQADLGTVDGAIGLALTAADILTVPAVRTAAAAEFARSGGVVDVEALVRR